MEKALVSLFVLAGICTSAALAEGPTTAPAAAAPNGDLAVVVQELRNKLQQQEQRIAELEAGQKTVTKEAARAALAEAAREMGLDAGKQAPMPKWLENLKFYGDVRLRFQDEHDNIGTKYRNRLRYRLRLGVIKTWLEDQVETGFQLASGETDDPTTTNETMGDNFARDPIWIDLAYASYRPKAAPGLTITGGKMRNPLLQTDLIWDTDINPEGFWAGYRFNLCKDLELFANAGYFLLTENFKAPFGTDKTAAGAALDVTLRDATLQTYQAGFGWKFLKDAKWTFALTYYAYDDIDTGFRTAAGNSTQTVVFGPASADKYSRLSAGGFRVIDMLNKVDFRLFNLPWTAYFDVLQNTANQDAGAYAGQDTAYAFGLKAGENKKKGDWSLGYVYRYVQANSTPGEFAEANYSGTNVKGHEWRAVYNITDFLTLSPSLFWFEPVTGSHENERTIMSRVDLTWSF